MRLFTTVFALLAFSVLAGCAAPTTATRGSDTAVRAEARRISDAVGYADRVHEGKLHPTASLSAF